MSRNGEFGFGLIGAGNIGKLHAQVVRELEGARLAAVCALPLDAARTFAEEHGCRACRTVEDLVNDPGVDIVTIGTPSGLHPEQAVAAARAGKHVLVEKPLAISLEGADAAIRAAQESGVKLGVISQRRFDHVCQAMKQAAVAGEFGKLVFVNGSVLYYREPAYYSSSDWRGTWKLDGGGALMNQGIHTVDLVRWLGGPVRSVAAFSGTISHDIEVEDAAAAVVEFESGALGSIKATTSAYPGLHIRVEIMGDKGSAILQDSDFVIWKSTVSGGPPELSGPKTGSGSSDPMAFSAAGHLAQFQEFLDAIREDRQPLVDGAEGRATLELVLAAYESARRKQIVGLPL